jgi:hypothetical protein
MNDHSWEDATDWCDTLIRRQDFIYFLSGSEAFMKTSKAKTAVAAREWKRRIENPLTEAQKTEKADDEVERQQMIQRTLAKQELEG